MPAKGPDCFLFKVTTNRQMKEAVEVTVPTLVLAPGSVLFPGTVIRVSAPYDWQRGAAAKTIGRENQRKLATLVRIPSDRDVVVAVIPRHNDKDRTINDVGVLARLMGQTEGPVRLILQGLTRFRLVERKGAQSRVAVYETSESEITSGELDPSELGGRVDALKDSVRGLVEGSSGSAGVSTLQRFFAFAEGVSSPGTLVDVLLSLLPVDHEEKLRVLNAVGTRERLETAIDVVDKKTEAMRVSRKINQTVDKSVNKKQREFILRQQLKAIKDELGELEGDGAGAGADDDGDDDGLKALTTKLQTLQLPPEGRKIVNRELRRLKRMNAGQAEYQVTRTYLETIAELPWGTYDNGDLDISLISRAKTIFDQDHYGLEKVKKRLVEYLSIMYLKQAQSKRLPVVDADAEAVESRNDPNSRALVPVSRPDSEEHSPADQPPQPNGKPNTSAVVTDRAPILLLVGPPGVGKTSLAKSVARALGRKLHRISLGGVRDEAEIRGHRRTYVGSMPGVMVQALRKAGTMNPVIVLDEIDKVAQGNYGTHGDPSAAMLEVLDPEQNYSFTDHYINFPVDLSKVIFIATANSTETIPGPLLDRMETIRVEGYTYMEKQHIAENYLIPKQIEYNGLEKGQLHVPAPVIQRIATRYTREAGVRSLERELGALFRAFAVEQLEGGHPDAEKTLTVDDVKKYLGIEKFHDDVVNDKVDEYVDNATGQVRHRHVAGVVNGLAYMGSGTGGLLMFEATLMPQGDGKLKMTGSLGDVISESAQIALSWMRSNSARLGIEPRLLKDNDVHLHAPAGAIPKDGPSAGVAMTTTFVSLLLNKKVPQDIAMTGEMTLRGKILPVGGIREKLLGAHLAGVNRIILPFHNAKNVDEECSFVKETGMTIDYVKYIWDVFAIVWPEEHSAFLSESRL